jgi:cytochrome c553
MLKFNNLMETPPGGFKFFVAETGEWFESRSFATLVDRVKAHLRANNLSIPLNLEEIAEDQRCQHMPDGICYEADNTVIWKTAPRPGSKLYRTDFHMILSGTQTLASWVLQDGKKKVDQSVADSRAATCATCHFNTDIEGCTTCSMGGLNRLVNSIVGAEATSSDARLKACHICGCSLRAKVWCPTETLQRHMPPDRLGCFPDWCWMRTEQKD